VDGNRLILEKRDDSPVDVSFGIWSDTPSSSGYVENLRVNGSTAKMSDVLLDSNILIDHLRDYSPARLYLKQFESRESVGFITTLTVAEISACKLIGADEETRVKRLLSIFDVADLIIDIAWQAGEIRLRHGLRLADAIVAATAISRNLKLVTRNLVHFQSLERLNVVKPYD
jgi:predicted nucleic acid-binding protein